MSRVSVLESLYTEKKSALEFNYDNLWAPPIRSLLSNDDINELIRIATSLRYNGKIEMKYKLIDKVMNRRGFRKAHCGTNRVVYNFLEDTRFVAKIAIDRVGMTDSPKEFKNQNYFKPFCCKIFEVDPSGVIAFVERVNPITSLEEFLSVSDDIFNMIITKIVGKYVVDDIGTSKFMNFGNRMGGFGPVIIDFPYAYELDGNKLQCNRLIDTPNGKIRCGGEIDYDNGFNYLICTKCGKTYQARDLAANSDDVLILNREGRLNIMTKVRVVNRKTREVILDDSTSTKTYISKKQFEEYNSSSNKFSEKERVSKTITKRRPKKNSNEYYTQLMLEKFNKQSALNNRPFEDLLSTREKVKVSDAKKKSKEKETTCTTADDPHYTYEESEAVTESVNEVVEKVMDTMEGLSDKAKEAIDTIVNSIYGPDEEPKEEKEEEQEKFDLADFKFGPNVEEQYDYSNYEVEEESEDDYYDDEDVQEFEDYEKEVKCRNKPYNKKFNKQMRDEGY